MIHYLSDTLKCSVLLRLFIQNQHILHRKACFLHCGNDIYFEFAKTKPSSIGLYIRLKNAYFHQSHLTEKKQESRGHQAGPQKMLKQNSFPICPISCNGIGSELCAGANVESQDNKDHRIKIDIVQSIERKNDTACSTGNVLIFTLCETAG